MSPILDSIQKKWKDFEDNTTLGESGVKELSEGLTFGDVVFNGYAAEDNQQRIGVAIRNEYPKGILCTDMEGKFWYNALDKDSRLTIIGNVLDEAFGMGMNTN